MTDNTELKSTYSRRVQLNLSKQNRLVLLVVCLIALAGMLFLYLTDLWRLRQQPEPEVVRVEMTYEVMFREVAARYGLDWRLLARQAYYESDLNAQAVGASQDTGLMQIIPATWDEWAPQVGVSDPYDPYSNVLVAAAYLAFLRDHFAKMGYTDERWMLVAYNWGPHNLQQHLKNGGKWTEVPKKRRRYALNILREREVLPPGWELIRDTPVLVSLSSD